MDFAICPSCGQSVLDDDAVDCPFCGASMKSKPGAKSPAAAAKPTTPTKPAPATAAGKPAGKGAVKSAPTDDLPFDADTLAPSDAVPAAAAPSKAKSLAVLCPMCETTGYVPTSAAGKMVRCANPKCLVPTFRAPAPEPEKVAVVAPTKPKSNALVLGIATAAMVCVIGGGAYLFITMTSAKPPDNKPLTDEDIQRMKASAPKADGAKGNAVATAKDTATAVAPAEDPIAAEATAAAKMTDDALKLMNEVALLSGAQNRSKPLCRRLAAEANAMAGKISGAREQIVRLVEVGREVPFYRVMPMVELYWAETAAKNADGAKGALDQAVSLAAGLPKFGRDRLEIAPQLAAALIAAGRPADALSALEGRQSSDVDGEFAKMLVWLIADAHRTKLDSLDALQPAAPQTAPQSAATSAAAVFRGHAAAALQFALGAKEPTVIRDGVSGWAEALVSTVSVVEASPQIESAVAPLPPATQAYIWARAARSAVAAGRADGARGLLAKAQAIGDGLQPTAEITIPNNKGIVRWKVVPTTEALAAGTAAAELALAHHQVTGDAVASSKMLEVALQFARSVGPSLPSIDEKQKSFDLAGPTVMRDQLKKELELRTDDDAKQALGSYRRALTELKATAQARFDFQTAVLSRATRLGMESVVWSIVSSRSSDRDVAQKEPYLATPISEWLLYRFQLTKASDEIEALRTSLTQSPANPLKPPLAAELVDHLTQGRISAAAAGLAAPGLKSDLRESIVFHGVVALASRGEADALWQLVGQQELVFREEFLQWAGLILARAGHVGIAWKQVSAVNGATEKVSLCRGIVAGLRDRSQ